MLFHLNSYTPVEDLANKGHTFVCRSDSSDPQIDKLVEQFHFKSTHCMCVQIKLNEIP